MKSNKNLAISKTYLPKDEIPYAEWVRQFNVGVNYPIDYSKSMRYDLNKDYDFSKLFKDSSQSKSIIDFSWILEKLNIFA